MTPPKALHLTRLIHTLSQAFDRLGLTFFAIDHQGYYWYQNTPLTHYTQNAACMAQADPKAWANCQAVMAQKTPQMIEETCQGTTFLSVKAPILDDQRNTLGLVGLSFNITVRKQAETALQEAKQAAEQAHQMKTEFLNNISHELRLPLANMQGVTEQLVQNTALDHPMAKSIQSLHGVCQGFLQVFDELLAYTAEPTPHPLSDVAVAPFAQSLLNVFQLQAQQAGITLEYTLADNVPATIKMDVYSLKKILLHLLNNAVKFTSQGGTITLHVTQEEQASIPTLQWHVRDTGIGIPVKEQARIFEPFVRLHPTAQSRYKGVGLGLTEAQHLSQALGGHISLKSEPHQGSQFTLCLPFKQALPSVPPLPNSAKASNTYFNAHVLVVEDDTLAQTIAQRILESLGCHVEVASNRKQAEVALNKIRYDLIFMDIGLPDGNGLDITRQLRRAENASLNIATPVIALTAHILTTIEADCTQVGMQVALQKPLTSEKACQMLNRYCAKKE